MDQGVSGSVATRLAGSGRASSGKPGPSAERKSGATTRPGPGRPLTARSDPARPGQRPGLVPGTLRPGPCAAPYSAAPYSVAPYPGGLYAAAPYPAGPYPAGRYTPGRLAASPLPIYRRPWVLGLERLAVPPDPYVSIEDAVRAFVRDPIVRPGGGSGATSAAPRGAAPRLPGAARYRRIETAVRRRIPAPRQRWRGVERAGTLMAEMVFSVTIGALAVLLTLALMSTLLPGAAAGGVALGFVTASGAFSGYASWRWVRWARDRADRLHWSVIASAGAAMASAELYGAAAIVASHSGFLERIAAFGGLGFVTAVTVAVTGAASLISYHRSVTDAQLYRFARRYA